LSKAHEIGFVEFSKVQKSYDGESLVVKDLNLSVGKGEFLTMLGPCPSSYKMGHQSGLSFGGSVSSVGLIMQPAFDVASGDIGLSVS